MDVLRALALGQLRLGPGELEPFSREVAVERSLRGCHEGSFGALAAGPASAERDAHHAAPADADRLELDAKPVEIRTAREPGGGGQAHAASLLGADHLERLAVRLAALLLHLRDDDAPAAPDDEIELVPAGVDVGA